MIKLMSATRWSECQEILFSELPRTKQLFLTSSSNFFSSKNLLKKTTRICFAVSPMFAMKSAPIPSRPQDSLASVLSAQADYFTLRVEIIFFLLRSTFVLQSYSVQILLDWNSNTHNFQYFDCIARRRFSLIIPGEHIFSKVAKITLTLVCNGFAHCIFNGALGFEHRFSSPTISVPVHPLD